MNIYYIGGSPCAGKSSVAEILLRRYGLNYFKIDDFLDRSMQAVRFLPGRNGASAFHMIGGKYSWKY